MIPIGISLQGGWSMGRIPVAQSVVLARGGTDHLRAGKINLRSGRWGQIARRLGTAPLIDSSR
jgi:hypothetical protein